MSAKQLFTIALYLPFLALLAACSPAVAFQPLQAGEADLNVESQRPAATAPALLDADDGVMREQESAEEALVEATMESAPTAGGIAAPADGEAVAPQNPDEPPVDMFFEEYGTNPFVVTAQDQFSTFAIDVDTGAYTVARRYLNDGLLPPPEAIRLEEFVNYFDQAYPIPQNDDFEVYLEAAPTPFSEYPVLRIGVQGYQVSAEDRPDANLYFVIDVSGSMDGPERLGAVKEALLALVDELRPTDTVGIIVYGNRGRVLLEPTPVEDSRRIIRAINSLNSEGSTNAEEGLLLAYTMATENFDADRINRIILCSDGVANVGNTGPDAILETVRTQAREGISLTTVGFGMGNYNDVLMEQLANDGDGQYFYADTQDEADRIFVDNLTGTLLTIGKNAKIQVEFNPDTVESYRLMGYENRDVADEDFRNDDVDAGEIGAGHSVTALYELVLNGQVQGDAVIAIARLRWEDPETGAVTEIERDIRLDQVQGTFEEASPTFQLSAGVAAFADALGEGAWGQAEYSTIYKVASAAAGRLGQDSDVLELLDLIQRADRLN